MEKRTVAALFPWEADSKMELSGQDAYYGVSLEGTKARVGREKSSCKGRPMTDSASVSGATTAFQGYPKLGQDAQAFIPSMEHSLDVGHPRKGSDLS